MLSGTKKYELSEEYKKEDRYKSLKKSEKVLWYFKVKDSRKFDEIKKWDLTFEDDFNAKKLDSSRWLTRYFWGEALLNDSYSLDNEKQFMNYDKNLTLSDSKLIIITKQEKVRGKAWNPTVGFFARDFEYTSGTLNTGINFRQQYGLFEAKIRFNRNYPVNHALWLVSDYMLPHIDIAKAAKNVTMGNYWGTLTAGLKPEKNEFRVNSGKYAADFYIFSLEWTATRLIWKINGVTVASVREGVPQVPMYLNLGSSLYEKTHTPVFPASFEVDWIRCYRSK
jgi:beta-glucanase (GH16 family)